MPVLGVCKRHSIYLLIWCGRSIDFFPALFEWPQSNSLKSTWIYRAIRILPLRPTIGKTAEPHIINWFYALDSTLVIDWTANLRRNKCIDYRINDNHALLAHFIWFVVASCGYGWCCGFPRLICSAHAHHPFGQQKKRLRSKQRPTTKLVFLVCFHHRCGWCSQVRVRLQHRRWIMKPRVRPTWTALVTASFAVAAPPKKQEPLLATCEYRPHTRPVGESVQLVPMH